MSDAHEERDLLAAEYVLGTLDATTTREIAVRARSDPALAAAIAAWEKRLAPLSSLVAPATPPDTLWERLAVSIGTETRARPASTLLRAWRSIDLWRTTTAVGFAVAAAVGAFFWLRPLPPRPVAALVPYGSAAATYVAELQPNGTLRLTALGPVSVEAGKDLELWALPKGATRPIALGLLPSTGRSVAPPEFPAQGMQLLVSLEPRGGSPTGLPTGPVLFAGTLHSAD
ncbi:MAG TPA: anti-sigma factor [Acetobacteraceae bacterium]|jgi:anti-sigma-K factor RskA